MIRNLNGMSTGCDFQNIHDEPCKWHRSVNPAGFAFSWNFRATHDNIQTRAKSPIASSSPAVSFGYILNGFFVGWSSKFFSFDEELSDSSYVSLFFCNQFRIENFLSRATVTHDIQLFIQSSRQSSSIDPKYRGLFQDFRWAWCLRQCCCSRCITGSARNSRF